MKRSRTSPSLANVASALNTCLPRLRILSLHLDTYGESSDAAALREIIEKLETACPTAESRCSEHFVVAGTFYVRRSQVATLLCCAFAESHDHSFRIVEFVKPPTFRFRVHPGPVIRQLDYPLNEGGALGIRCAEPGSALFRLDLESISSGLNAMARECPRHLADFLNDHTDAITGDAFLQCCLFGKLVC